jgi:hypothetical protein
LHPNITFLSHPFIVPISCEDFPYTNLTLTWLQGPIIRKLLLWIRTLPLLEE